MRPAIFLDRDGTLVEARHYPSTPEDLILYDGVADELARLQRGDGDALCLRPGQRHARRWPPTFKVICPTDSVPLLTAWSNDTDYAGALAAFIEPLIGRGDVLIGISTSGRSENVNRAAACAAQAGATVIALTGSSGNRLERLAHLALCVPCGSIEQIEDVHSIVSHSLCVALRDRIREFSDPVPIAATMPHTNGHQPGASGVPNGWRD